ncbi:MAG: LysM peptidoglycan-binding domain-containing protein [Candidatus Cloacimonetes bacterium]|nr:LysM peptidoglycan-binding domain-containing protein [Candidatus Cloacimonadota bacterium]
MNILTYDKKSLESKNGRLWTSVKTRIAVFFLLLLLPLVLSAEYQTHKVEKGETLYRLHKMYDVPVEQIKELNNLTDDIIHVDQVLKIKETSSDKPSSPAPKPTPQEEQKPAKPAPTETPKEKETKVPVKLDLPDDYYYTVQAGDNLYRISENHGIALLELEKWNNIADSKTHPLRAGDKLIVKDPSAYTGEGKNVVESPVPVVEDKVTAPADTVVVERIYVVQKGDTLFRIAKENGMTVDELKERNSLSSNDIKVGQRLWLVGNPPAKDSSQASSSSDVSVRTDLFMPTQGRVTSEFGMRKGRAHKGIDIANKSGTPIYAALDGVVVFSGVQRGYGNVVLIEHPNFVITVYAHNEKNLVKVNDKVKRGQHIANMGSTGNSTGPHLHFEYRVKGTAINPRKVLPF